MVSLIYVLPLSRKAPFNRSSKRPFSNRAGKAAAILLSAVFLLGALLACSSSSPHHDQLVVNSVVDMEHPEEGILTLRAALASMKSGDTIIFAPELNGQTIELTLIGSEHSVLKGEVYAGGPPQFQGYADRDYGRSALYARKNVTIDASDLPDGITIRWSGGQENPARVLAVYGNLNMTNVAITGGCSAAEPTGSDAQPYTLARGGGLAVWGIARLDRCTISGNTAEGDSESSRDRGTYGGGIYANGLVLNGCTVSGNSARGYGAAGGGIYSVGGSDGYGINVTLTGCTISGNRVTGQHAYGGGIFSLGGGPVHLKSMRLTNCTIARNLVEDHPELESSQYYYRGGGVYLGGGYLRIASCTIVENEVTGPDAVFSNKPNVGGGGVAATIGNAHVVESIEVWHSIIAGNQLNGEPEDIFTGSLLHFYSYGYNLIDRIDFSQMLVPVPAWRHLSRKHWPKQGDAEHGVDHSEVLSLADVAVNADILSRGTDAGGPAVLWYRPTGSALDKIPDQRYTVSYVTAGYDGYGSPPDPFLNMVLEKLGTNYADELGSDFGANFRAAFETEYELDDISDVTWYRTIATWPVDPRNAPWISFWRDLDAQIGDRLGAAILADSFWDSFQSGPLGGNVTITVSPEDTRVTLADSDQLGNERPAGPAGDIGAIEW
jgi:hypothetical protein